MMKREDRKQERRRKDMLNFSEFQKYVEMNISDFLPEKYKSAEVWLNPVKKNNGTELHAVLVRDKESNIAPNIYLDGYFKSYEEGAALDQMAEIL